MFQLKDEKKSKKISASELSELIDESTFESTFFNKEDNNTYGHFSSIIKEIKDGKNGSHLVKIRPPLFYLNGVLSNLSRLISGTGTRKILDNERWREKELEHLENLHPDVKIDETPFDNAFLVEKIDGKVAYDILRDEETDKNSKIKSIKKITKGLYNIHKKDLYHGEPNTQNCILTENGEVYWIDFEIEYHPDLKMIERKSKDLEQLLLSIMGAFEEEGELGIDDEELINLVLDSYDDKDVKSHFLKNPDAPALGPFRMLQLSFSNMYRFYQAQINLIKYISNWEYDY
ncbi:MAG: hypothetical protein ACOC5D_03990 [Thermoplasmatota archaeon]